MRGAVPDGYKSDDGDFVKRAADGFIQIGTLIQTGVITETWCLLDWPQIRKWANELLDDAIDWDYEGKLPPEAQP